MAASDLNAYPEILGSMTSDDGQVFVLQVRDAQGNDKMVGLPHRDIPRLVELAALQVPEGARLRGDKDLSVFNTRSFSVGISEGGQIILSLTIGGAAKLSFVLPGGMSAQLSETLAIASAKKDEAASGGLN